MKKSFLSKGLAVALTLMLALPSSYLLAEENKDTTTTTTPAVEETESKEAEDSKGADTEDTSSTEESSSGEETTESEASSESVESATEEDGLHKFTDEQLLAAQTLLGTVWFQKSGEMRALFLQGYQIARLRLDQALEKKGDKPLAIALDLDETVLDNSPYQAQGALDGTTFNPKTWDDWCRLKQAKAVPGAVDFLNYADSKGVQIYYISDRSMDVLQDTIENLKALNIPVQAEDHLMLKDPEDKSGKKNRREKVTAENELIMLFGDNLNDFTEFSKKDLDERLNMVEELKEEFGDRFIIFPNPIYGSFESAIYGPEKLDAAGKLAAREKALEPIHR